jgi:hypothetical protein
VLTGLFGRKLEMISCEKNAFCGIQVEGILENIVE